jgi:ABC-type polysaccharide/polyol phosphate export permease
VIAVDAPTPQVALAKVWAIFVRDARIALSYRANFFVQLASVAVSVVIAYFISIVAGHSVKVTVGTVTMSYFDYLAVNLAFVRFQSTGVASYAEVIRDSQTAGTLEVTLSTPTSLPIIVLSAGLWAFTFATLQSIVFLAVAMLFGLDLGHVDIATLLVFLVLTMISSSPLGVAAAALAMYFKKTGAIDFAVGTLTMIFGGVYLPLTALPPIMQWIGWSLPITHALGGLRAALAGLSIAQVWGEVVWLLAASMLLLPLALWLFSVSVRRAKIDGTLAQY